jgi:hypothetical protein
MYLDNIVVQLAYGLDYDSTTLLLLSYRTWCDQLTKTHKLHKHYNIKFFVVSTKEQRFVHAHVLVHDIL